MDCVFCSIVSGAIPSRTLSTSKHSVAVLDAFPLAAGHTLVLSRRHCPKLQDMDADENSDLFAMVKKMASRIDSALCCSSLVAIHNGPDAGQEVPHLHVHIVPRKKGDSAAGAIHELFKGSSGADSDIDVVHDLLNDTE